MKINITEILSQIVSVCFFWRTRHSKVPKRPFKRKYRK